MHIEENSGLFFFLFFCSPSVKSNYIMLHTLGSVTGFRDVQFGNLLLSMSAKTNVRNILQALFLFLSGEM